MRGFTNIIKHSLLRVATVITTLLVGTTLALITSAASATEIEKVVIEKPQVVEKVVLPPDKVAVMPADKQVVKPASKSDIAVRPVNPFFFRPFFFNPFFDEEFD